MRRNNFHPSKCNILSAQLRRTCVASNPALIPPRKCHQVSLFCRADDDDDARESDDDVGGLACTRRTRTTTQTRTPARPAPNTRIVFARRTHNGINFLIYHTRAAVRSPFCCQIQECATPASWQKLSVGCHGRRQHQQHHSRAGHSSTAVPTSTQELTQCGAHPEVPLWLTRFIVRQANRRPHALLHQPARYFIRTPTRPSARPHSANQPHTQTKWRAYLYFRFFIRCAPMGPMNNMLFLIMVIQFTAPYVGEYAAFDVEAQ